MTTIGTFDIEGSFKITGRGLVIYGDIIRGTVTPNNFFTFNDGRRDMQLKIKGVDFIDKLTEKTAKIGSTFYYNNDKQKEDLQTLQITKQIAIIMDYDDR